MKKVDLIGPGISMPSWPIATAASSVAVTLPKLKPPSFFGPSQKPTASATKIASSGYCRSVVTSQSIMLHPARHRR